MASSRHQEGATRNKSTGRNSTTDGPAPKFSCRCGLDHNNKMALDEHMKTDCPLRGFSCEFCNEHLIDSDAMGKHLFQCGNKTEKCPHCKKYIRRAVYNFHRDNNCIDLDEDEIVHNLRENRFNSHSENNASNNKDSKPIQSQDEYWNETTSSVERIPFDLENSLVNTSPKKAKQNAVTVLQSKASKIHESLFQQYYPTEVNHVTEKFQFNVILIGSPRVGKSQLINAICNDENKAETSASLNSCTREIKCYCLQDNQEQIPGTKPFRINFYDTPGIESWINEGGRAAMIKFIQENDPICVIYCASPGSFADLSQIRPVMEFCREKKIFWAFVCTNMWSGATRRDVIAEFEKELAVFGNKEEKFFDQSHTPVQHQVTVFNKSALCTMVNSTEYSDPDLLTEKMPVQGVDELIHCIMEALDNEKLIGWCHAILYRRSFWEKFSQKTSGFLSLRIKDMQNINKDSVQTKTAAALEYIIKLIKRS